MKNSHKFIGIPFIINPIYRDSGSNTECDQLPRTYFRRDTRSEKTVRWNTWSWASGSSRLGNWAKLFGHVVAPILWTKLIPVYTFTCKNRQRTSPSIRRSVSKIIEVRNIVSKRRKWNVQFAFDKINNSMFQRIINLLPLHYLKYSTTGNFQNFYKSALNTLD